MIAEGTRHFIERADTRVAAFCKGAVNPRAVNAAIAGNRQHTARLSRNTQSMGGVDYCLQFVKGGTEQ